MNKILLGLMLLLSMSAYAEEFPTGLRLPTKQELSQDSERKESPAKLAKVTADFNGDGKPDTAFLLINIKNNNLVLAVKLSSENGYDWKILNKEKFGLSGIGIDLAKPGEKYDTACGKGYWECGKNEPKSITLKNAGFWYIAFEKADSLVFWNHKKMIFEQIPTSD
jgi:hypothetical protein